MCIKKACGIASNYLSILLSNFIENIKKPKCFIDDDGSNTFDIAFKIKNNGDDTRYDFISICVALDGQSNRNDEDIINNPYPEIALFKHDKIIYLEDIGFKYTKKFTDIREFILEVKKLVS